MENKKNIFSILILLPILSITAALQVAAQEKEVESKDVASKQEVEPAKAIPEMPSQKEEKTSVDTLARENTYELCTDKKDNDGDNYVDCEDQDCGIYAVCVHGNKNWLLKRTIKYQLGHGEHRPGRCMDGIDNNGNGLVDCHEPACQRLRYCRKQMYERDRPKGKPQGLFLSGSLGVALPNFAFSKVRVDSVQYDNIPFDPDIGGMGIFKIGYSPLSWLGFGVNLMGGITFATNRSDMILLGDSDNKYKYYGHKLFVHMSGFVRLFHEFSRLVLYMDVAGGYSHVRYNWEIYNAAYTWEDIVNSDHDLSKEKRWKRSGHFILVLEPGFDIYIISRLFAMGARAWIPIPASSDYEMDNNALFLTLTITPSWREPKKLKPQYQ